MNTERNIVERKIDNRLADREEKLKDLSIYFWDEIFELLSKN